MARVFAIASAKGGVGKTTTTANLGVILAETGADVVVIDGDIGMANLGAVLGIESPPTTLHDVLSGSAKPSEATYEGPGGVYVVPGDTALSSYAPADPEKLPSVLRTHSQADYVLIDVGAGVSHETSLPLSLADEVLLVSTPERDALRDTEKTRQLTEQLGGTVAGAVITRTDASTPVSELATGTLAATVLASIPEDEAVRNSLAVGEPLSTYAPESPAAAAYRELVAELTDIAPEAPSEPETASDTATTRSDSTAEPAATDDDPADSEPPASGTPPTPESTPAATAESGANTTPDNESSAAPVDVANDDQPAPETESKWAEAATGTGIDVDKQLADEAAAMSEADAEPPTTDPTPSADKPTKSAAPDSALDDESAVNDPADSENETPSADATAAADNAESAAADTDASEVTPAPTSETITETAADTASPIADVADGITPAPSADADTTTDEQAIPFRDAEADDETATNETTESNPTTPDERGDDTEPLIPDAEDETPSTTADSSAMTTELGATTDEPAADVEPSAEEEDDEEKGFFRRLFFG